MKLKQLQYFRSLAKNLHYSATADELNIAQPTLSRVISQLESDLDVCLFEKQGRCIELTKHGKIFLEHIEKALYEIELAEKIIYESKNNQNDIIDLGFIFSLGYEYIPKLVKKFLNENINFDCSFNFYQGDTLELLTKLKARECDLVLCSYICNEPEIEFHQVLTQELVIIASKNHPISQLNSIALKDVSKYSFILPLDKAFYIESLFDDMGLKLNTLCRVQEDSSIIGLVSENCGISMQ